MKWKHAWYEAEHGNPDSQHIWRDVVDIKEESLDWQFSLLYGSMFYPLF